jgi:hypothetical protein
MGSFFPRRRLDQHRNKHDSTERGHGRAGAASTSNGSTAQSDAAPQDVRVDLLLCVRIELLVAAEERTLEDARTSFERAALGQAPQAAICRNFAASTVCSATVFISEIS